jgi:ZIP family zinc transporter
MLGFAAGVMIAASYWSLLEPALAMSAHMLLPKWLPATVGFLSGAIFLRLMDLLLPHLHVGLPLEETTLSSALALTLGIGIQNLPEGLAVSMPLRREDLSKAKSFSYGQLSAIVEPISAVLGASATMTSRSLLPYALSFAAGAMIFVVVEDLIPEAQREGNSDISTYGVISGFLCMMVLDVAFS